MKISTPYGRLHCATGVPTTVAGLPLVGRLGVEIQMTAVVR